MLEILKLRSGKVILRIDRTRLYNSLRGENYETKHMKDFIIVVGSADGFG